MLFIRRSIRWVPLLIVGMLIVFTQSATVLGIEEKVLDPCVPVLVDGRKGDFHAQETVCIEVLEDPVEITASEAIIPVGTMEKLTAQEIIKQAQAKAYNLTNNEEINFTKVEVIQQEDKNSYIVTLYVSDDISKSVEFRNEPALKSIIRYPEKVSKSTEAKNVVFVNFSKWLFIVWGLIILCIFPVSVLFYNAGIWSKAGKLLYDFRKKE